VDLISHGKQSCTQCAIFKVELYKIQFWELEPKK